MDVTQAFERLKSLDSQAAAIVQDYVHGVLKKNVLVLAEDEAFALQNEHGQIRATKGRLRLSSENGGLVQPVYNGPWVVSAQGYEMLAEATGTCVIFPKTVIVDGIEQANPHVIRDPNNNRILNIYARAVAFRFSRAGLPQVADWTTTYDVPAYRMIDLIAKAKKFPQAFRLLPNDMAPPEDGTWARYHFDEAVVLYVNTTHDEAMKWYGEILNREKKAIDFAQTFARRNATKHLLGLQKAPAPVWDVTIHCWRPDNGSLLKWDTTQYADIQRRVEALTESQDFALPEGQNGKQTIELKRGTERIEDEAELLGSEDDQDEGKPMGMAVEPESDQTYDMGTTNGKTFSSTPPKDVEPESSPVADDDPETAKMRANLAVAAEAFKDIFLRACHALAVSPDHTTMTAENMRAVSDAMNRQMDAMEEDQ
ncbi:hypothetical protein [Desulfovibrio inopinatus]|uniref:hypothetical protein n=1 Tax=Desulfovibrio inopinatus TaxID=102109 RepID=UPI00040373AE|nr:hypothetical protein [Desulfovibrio inopinatus]